MSFHQFQKLKISCKPTTLHCHFYLAPSIFIIKSSNALGHKFEGITFLQEGHAARVVLVQLLPGNLPDEAQEVEKILSVAQTLRSVQ